MVQAERVSNDCLVCRLAGFGSIDLINESKYHIGLFCMDIEVCKNITKGAVLLSRANELDR